MRIKPQSAQGGHTFPERVHTVYDNIVKIFLKGHQVLKGTIDPPTVNKSIVLPLIRKNKNGKILKKNK